MRDRVDEHLNQRGVVVWRCIGAVTTRSANTRLMPSRLLGLEDFTVLDAVEDDGELVVTVRA